MEKKGLHDYICKIIDESFNRLTDVYKNSAVNNPSKLSRLVFPRYRKSDKLRISEQELRFIFVEVFNQYCDESGLELFYSIETPSLDKYDFKESPRRSDNGQSAMFDLVIFDKDFKRVALIEFKANNADEKSHQKDMVKLVNSNEGTDDVLRYFLEIVENYDKGTIASFSRKLSYTDSVIIKIYSLKKEETLKI